MRCCGVGGSELDELPKGGEKMAETIIGLGSLLILGGFCFWFVRYLQKSRDEDLERLRYLRSISLSLEFLSTTYNSMKGADENGKE